MMHEIHQMVAEKFDRFNEDLEGEPNPLEDEKDDDLEPPTGNVELKPPF